MAWIDIALLAVIVLFAIVGTFRGFFDSLIKLCGTFVTLVLSVFLAKPVATVLQTIFHIKDGMAGLVTSPITPYCLDTKGNGEISNFFVDKFAKLLMGNGYWQNYPQGAQDAQFISDFSWKIGELIAIVISAIIMFILIRVLLAILTKFIHRLHEYRTIGSFDKWLGLAFGAFKGFIYVCVIFVGTYLVSSALPVVGDTVLSWLDGSAIAKPMFNWMASFTDSSLLPWLGSIV